MPTAEKAPQPRQKPLRYFLVHPQLLEPQPYLIESAATITFRQHQVTLNQFMASALASEVIKKVMSDESLYQPLQLESESNRLKKH